MVMIVMPPAPLAPMAPCAKRNQKGLLHCHGRQLLKVRSDAINHNHNNNKKRKQKQQTQQNSQLASSDAAAAASSVVNSDSPPVKRPHVEVVEADGEPQGSAIKRPRIQLSQYSNQANDYEKSQSADNDDGGCPPPLNPTTFASIKKKRSHEAATCAEDDDDDDESQQQQASAAIKRPRISHVLKLLRSAPSESDYVEPYSPTSPGFVWPQNTRNKVQFQVQKEEEGLYAHDESQQQQQQMKRPTIIDHIDFASTLVSCSAATGGDDEVLVTDQGFINDLLNLSSLLRSACI